MSLQSPDTTKTFEQTCINTIRILAVDAVQKANSGHPGMPMGWPRSPTCSGRGS